MADDTSRTGGEASGRTADGESEIPLGQRLFDSPFLLLGACLFVMFLFYTGWGLWEVFTLPEAPLP